MKQELIQNIHPEDYHNVVYPLVVKADYLFQPTLEGDLTVVINEEKYPFTKPEEILIPDKIHPLQMPFIRKP